MYVFEQSWGRLDRSRARFHEIPAGKDRCEYPTVDVFIPCCSKPVDVRSLNHQINEK